MPVETTKKRFTTDDYYRMAEVGILTPEDRVELIDGEIVEMTAIGVRHAGCVNAAAELFTKTFSDHALVSTQNPLRLNDYSELQPDIVLLRRTDDFYRSRHPEPQDVYLVIEVADTSLAYDRDVKLKRYAGAGVMEVWIEDLSNERLLVFRDPLDGDYQTKLTLPSGDNVSVMSLSGKSFSVSDLLG